MLPNLALHSLLNYLKDNHFEVVADSVSKLSGVSHLEIQQWSNSRFEGILVEPYIVELAFELAADLTKDICIGLECSKLARPHGFESYLLALMSAKDTGDAINTVLVKYAPQVIKELYMNIESTSNGNMFVSFGSSENDKSYKYLIDFCLSALFRLARRLPVHSGAKPVSLTLKRDCPEKQIIRYETFFNCSVKLSAEQNLLELGPDFTGTRSELAGGISQIFTDFLIKKSSVRKGKAFYQKVQNAIEVQLTEGIVNVDIISSRLNVSSRTLQKRLASEGESFRELYEKATHRRALYFLTQTPKSISQISDALGYSTEASFIRAFRRWEGVTPAAFRKQYLS